MVKPVVVDLSHWNTVNSLDQAKSAGVLGIIHKMSEGMGGVDAQCDDRWRMAKDAGLLWGVYHFLRPGNLVDQANYFVDKAMPVTDENSLFAADHEDAGVSLNDLCKFLDQVEKRTGRSPVIYSGNVLKEQLGGKADSRLKGRRLWLAQYSSTPTMPAGFNDYWIWQYSDGSSGPSPHTVAGIASPCDCNDYKGTAEQLRAEWSGKAGAVVEPPAGGAVDPPPATGGTGLSPSEFQMALKSAGFDPGVIDGLWGPNTSAATEAWFNSQSDLALG